LRAEFPDHPLFCDPLFASPEFAAFATEMQHVCGSTREEDPHLVAVAKAVPAMAERLRTTAATVEAGNAATVTALADLRAELAEVKASLQDFVQGRFSFTFTPGRSRMLPQGWDPLLSQGQGRPVSPPSPSLRGRPPLTPQPPSAPVAAVSLAPPPPVSLGGQPPPAPLVVSAESSVPSYRLSREVYTIPDLWREWTVGLAVGLPSIDDLDRRWGSRWRSPKERQYYSTRKVIIDEVRRRAASYGEAQAVARMEEERLVAKASLDRVSKMLRAATKKAGGNVEAPGDA